MHKSNSDLDAAIGFVIDRISEQGTRCGTHLSDHERHFLHYLPTHPTNPTLVWREGFYSRTAWPTRPLRDYQFERLCALAKDAHRYDVETGTSAKNEWKFAAAVLQLNNHPMAWFLNWAGIRTRARWSGCLLVCTATLIIILFSLAAFAMLVFIRSERELPFSVIEIVCGASLVAAIVASYAAAQRLDHWLGQREVERYRCRLQDGIPRVTS